MVGLMMKYIDVVFLTRLPQAYEREVRWREGPAIRKELDVMFDTLRDGRPVPAPGPSVSAVKVAGAKPAAAVKRRPRKAAKPKASNDKEATPACSKEKVKQALAHRSGSADKRAREQKVVLQRRQDVTRRKKLADKAKRAKPGKQARMTTTQKAFDCRMGLRWSSWQKVLEKDASSHTYSPFKRERDVPAVYEIAVQPAKGAKKQIVYCCCSEGLPVGRTLRSYLLGSDKLQAQTNNVLAQGCCVFVRRCQVRRPIRCCMQKVKTAGELKRLILKHYEYAWNRALKQLTDVTIKGVNYCKAV